MCELFSSIANWLISIVTSLIAAYIILLLIKRSSYNKIKEWIGTYYHENDNQKKIRFEVKFVKHSLYTLVPRITISIHRLYTNENNVAENWDGDEFNSDILNSYFFKGLYIIQEPNENDKHGYMEAVLFERPKRRIALHLFYIDSSNRWKTDQGYYIEKSN